MTDTATAPPDPREVVIDRLIHLEQQIRGPGMGTSISGGDLAVLLGALQEARAEAAQSRRATARRGGAKGKAAGDGGALAEVIPAIADILEGHPELWGQPLLDVLKAYCEQTNIDYADWGPAVERALAGAAV